VVTSVGLSSGLLRDRPIVAGAMLTMIAAAMIPEVAVDGRPNEVGLSTLVGFLGAIKFKLLE
jgi:hypothetical protein